MRLAIQCCVGLSLLLQCYACGPFPEGKAVRLTFIWMVTMRRSVQALLPMIYVMFLSQLLQVACPSDMTDG